MKNEHDYALPELSFDVENFDLWNGGFVRCGSVRYRVLIDRELCVWTVSDETRNPYDDALHGGRITSRTNCFRVLADALQTIERAHNAHYRLWGKMK